jgi:hypothetical protein
MPTVKELVNALVDFPDCTFRVGIVSDIDKDKDTCTVQPVNGDAEMLGVQLKAIIDSEDNGYILYPKKDSNVLVGIIDGVKTHSFVAMLSEVESIKLVIDGNKITADKDNYIAKWKKWQFNDGNFGGMVKLVDPNDTSAGVLARLNKLEQAFTQHLIKFNTHMHPTAAPGLPSVPSTLDTQTISQTSRAQLEDKDVTH